MICEYLQKAVIMIKQYEFIENKPCQINNFTLKIG